jgi:hypothetical protein
MTPLETGRKWRHVEPLAGACSLRLPAPTPHIEVLYTQGPQPKAVSQSPLGSVHAIMLFDTRHNMGNKECRLFRLGS